MGLRAELLGRVRFSVSGIELRPRSRKGTALLAYLCMSRGGARRQDLAELLWGPGRSANLRQELYALRRLPGAAEWLREGDDVVSVAAETDVAELESSGVWPPGTPVGPVRLLPGLGRLDAPAFRDWLEQERERVAELAARLRRELAERLEEEGRLEAALDVVDAALAAEPLDERLHRVGMRCAYLAGDTEGALARFEACREALRREVGVEPTAETRALADGIGRGERLGSALDPARLTPELRTVVQALAVADSALDVEVLARVLGREPADVADDLARLERGGWLDRHLALAPEAARRAARGLPASTRQWLHRRLAEALLGSTGSSPATLATHLLRAGRPSEAAPHFVAAAESVAAEAGPGAAVPLLLRALWASWEDRETRLRAALLLEGCASQTGDAGLQEAALEAAEELAWESQSDESLAEVRMRRSRWLLRRGRVAEGLERAVEALEIAVRLKDARLVARARNAVGAAQFFAGDLDGAEASFRANVAADDVVERYRARNNLGSIAGIMGEPQAALAHLEEALTLARSAGQTSDVVGTLNNLAATAERAGEYRRAVRHLRESLSLARRQSDAVNEGHVLVNLSVMYSRIGELGPAWNTACEVEELAAEHDHARLALLAREQKAEVASLCGDQQAALAELAASAAVADALGDERKVAALRLSRAVVEAKLDPERLRGAAATLADASEPRLADLEPWFWLDLATTTLDPAEAALWADRAETSAVGGPHLRAVVALARLRVGLLRDATDAQRGAAARSLDALVGEDGAGGDLRELEFVQAPHARLLAARWHGLAGRAPADDDSLDRVEDELKAQAAGLPRGLAASLLHLPSRWSRGLRDTPLTPD
ncbi:MAG TPA: tetratricopeptide repeat protein [Longimicrobiales bacterium]